MLYFINPGETKKPAGRKRRAKATTKRRLDKRRKRSQVHSSSPTHRSASVPVRARLEESPSMATRRRKRRKATAKAAPRRRRRRTAVARMASNPPRRRRRRRTAVARMASNPPRRRRHHAKRRRSFRRNPPMVRGIVAQLTQGAKDGLAVVAGQIAVRKIRGAVTGMLPDAQKASVATGAGQVALAIAGALAVSVAARKIAPAQARMVTAGAFAEAVNSLLAQTPIAPYLGAFPPRRLTRVAQTGRRPGGQAAWPRQAAMPAALPAGGRGMGAWPAMRTVGMPVMAGM